MKLQTYFLEKVLLAFSDFLSIGRKNTKEEVVQRDPMVSRTEVWLLLCLVRSRKVFLPHLLSYF